ncbi:ABC transporter permease, partial [Paraburkholderia sp. BR10879]
MADVTSSSNRYGPPSRAGGSRLSTGRFYFWLSWAIPALIVVVWELAARVGGIAPQVVPGPSSVAAAAWG